jgi:predicted transglutaminase-like cysteine proteinase
MTTSYFNKPKKTSLKWQFAKVAAVVAAGYASYRQFVPDAAQNYLRNQVVEMAGHDSNPQAVNPRNLSFRFERDNAPVVMGEKTDSVFESRVNLMDEWYACMGRHEFLMGVSENRESFDKWLSQLNNLRGKSIEEKCAGVDALIDRQIAYALDPATYGKVEYFASPVETLKNGQGDCDDFAILKYYALRYLNVPAERMLITAVATADPRTQRIGDTVDHCVLIVDIREPGVLTRAWEGTFGTPKTSLIVLNNDQSVTGHLTKENEAQMRPHLAMNEAGIFHIPANSGLKWK